MCRPDMFKKYQKETNPSIYSNQLNTNDEKEIKINFKTYAKQTLYEKHFRIVEKNGDKVRVVCRHCQVFLKSKLSQNGFRGHLQVYL